MVVLHDLIHSSRVHQDFVGGVQVSFLLASRSAINSPYSFEVEFCISSFFSAIQSFPFAAGYHLIISEMLSISPRQAYSFVVDFLNNSVQPFLLSYFHSFLPILPEDFRCSSRQVPSHLVKFMFYPSIFQSVCCLNRFSLIPFLSCSNRSGFIVYLIP